MPLRPDSPFEKLKVEQGVALLQTGARTAASTLIWNEGQRHSVEVRLLDVVQTRNPFLGDSAPPEIWLVLDRSDAFVSLEEYAYASLDHGVFLRVRTAGAILFCECEIPPASLGHLDTVRLKLISSVYSAQRRSVFRLPLLTSGSEVRMKFEVEGRDGNLHARIKDLGEAGAALLVDEIDLLPWLQPKSILKNLHFKVDRRDISLDRGRITYVHLLSGSKTAKQLQVGVHFTQVPHAIRSWLSGMIFEKSTRFYGRR
jgi:hypothetical protein